MRDIPEKLAYSIWALPDSPWSRWVKPVLFAYMDEKGVGSQVFLEKGFQDRLNTLKNDHNDTAIVVNLPGVVSVSAGLYLIELGYRPVPLFNAAPGTKAVHRLDPIIHALEGGVEQIRDNKLYHDAAPAFLIDSNRTKGPAEPKPGTFDNRWVVFPQDFPSAGYLLRHGINRVVLVQKKRTPWQNDLCHVLCRWQDAGIGIEKLEIDTHSPAYSTKAPRPSFFRSLWYRWLTLRKFRRNAAGGFGDVVPDPSEGGSGGYG